MPTLSDRFSAYPVVVVLDGSGNGTIQFQAVGKNIRITNLYVSVSTRTLQSICTIYKGQIGAQFAIKNTNSGSTGASATGSIDLLDGESIYVQWTGGDAGATATATFTGSTLPFDVRAEPGGSFLFDDPIAAGDGSLIYPGLQSIDFVAGVSGWRIERDGDVEFNDGTFRGTLTIRNPTTHQGVVISPNSADIELHTPDSLVGLTLFPGVIFTNLTDSLTIGEASLHIQGPNPNTTSAQIDLFSENLDGTPRFIQLQGDVQIVGDNLRNTSDSHNYLRGEVGTGSINLVAATSGTLNVVFDNAFDTVPVCTANIDSGNAAMARWNARAINATVNGFTILIYRGDAADPAATFNCPVSWRATVA